MSLHSRSVTWNHCAWIMATGFLVLLPALRSPGQLVYTNDFESPVGSEWSRTNRDVTPIGARGFLGQFGNGALTLVLTNLPAHTEVDLSFDLFIIRSWDGLGVVGPSELWSVGLSGGPTFVRVAFSPIV